MSDSGTAILPFWGGPLNGRDVCVSVNAEEWTVLVVPVEAFKPAIASVKYKLFDGEFVQSTLLEKLQPKTITDVLRYLAIYMQENVSFAMKNVGPPHEALDPEKVVKTYSDGHQH